MPGDIVQAYANAHSRLLLLDYDGTLVSFKSLPHHAKPTPALLKLLGQLAAPPANKVVIISGRDHNTLETWLGHLPLDFASEHGLWLKESGSQWRLLHQQDNSWKKEAKAILDEFTRRLPGSLTEEKTASLAWHHRPAKDQAQAAAAIPQLIGRLKPLAHAHGLALLEGNKVLDLKLAGVDKGTVARHWLKQRHWDFILAAGDDTTDEDLFRAMPDDAFTIKIDGGGSTAARDRLKNYLSLRSLLKKLAMQP